MTRDNTTRRWQMAQQRTLLTAGRLKRLATLIDAIVAGSRAGSISDRCGPVALGPLVCHLNQGRRSRHAGFFSPDMQAAQAEQAALANDMKHALAACQLVLHLRARIDSVTA